MPMVILDVCPRCRVDVSRRLGLITTKSINCPKCEHEMFVTWRAVVNNWQYNAAVGMTLMVWVALIGLAFFAGEALMQPGANTTPGHMLAGAVLFGWFPALFVGFPFALVGRLVGNIVAYRLGAP